MRLIDLLNGIDYGAYAFFGFQLNQRPELRLFFQAGANIFACPWFLITLGIAAVGLLALQKRRSTFFLALAAGLLAFAVVEGVQRVHPRARPADSQNHPELVRQAASYPSRGVFFLVLAGSLAAYAAETLFRKRRWKVLVHALVIIPILWLCLSEIALGLHFVTDVIAGITGGGGLAMLVRALDRNRDLRAVPGPDGLRG